MHLLFESDGLIVLKRPHHFFLSHFFYGELASEGLLEAISIRVKVPGLTSGNFENGVTFSFCQ